MTEDEFNEKHDIWREKRHIWRVRGFSAIYTSAKEAVIRRHHQYLRDKSSGFRLKYLPR